MARKRHALSKTIIWKTWSGMRRRCANPLFIKYHVYGGRGISVCERWQTFENFYADMGDIPSSRHVLCRIDTDRGYEPGNCRWGTYQEQNNNTRRNQRIVYNGKTYTLAEAARYLEIPFSTIWGRHRKWGWSPEEIFRGERWS